MNSWNVACLLTICAAGIAGCSSGAPNPGSTADDGGPSVPVAIQYLELESRRDVHRIDVFVETGERNRAYEGRRFVGMVWRGSTEEFQLPLSFVRGALPYFSTVKREGSATRTRRQSYDVRNPRVQRVRSCVELARNDSLSLSLDPYQMVLTIKRNGEQQRFETDWCS